MINRAIDAEVPFSWVAADSVYGVGSVEAALRRAGKGYVLGVSSDHRFTSWIGKPPVDGAAEAIAKSLAASNWVRLSADEGTKGARLHDWHTASWPISTRLNTTKTAAKFGHAVF
jgi:SRSO17 transposase